MEPLEVIARFELQGKVMPLSLLWQGVEYTVEAVGRRWFSAEGEHILVMAHGGRMFELLYVAEKRQWFMMKTSASGMVA